MTNMPVAKKGSADGHKKNAKGTKKNKRKDTSLSDVPTSTGLPPKVDGQLRCHLRVSINQILWTVANAPDFTQVRLVWWGEDGEGTLFRPVDVKRGEKRGRMHSTTARFPVRAGPKQLASYFTDMGSLELDVLSGPNQVVVGRTQIGRIKSLTPNNPINGFFPVFSAEQEKVAELQVSLVLESLMASYDSMSSVPTPDLSLNVRDSLSDVMPVNPPRIVPTPAQPPVHSLSTDAFRSPIANKFQTHTEHAVPRGVDSLIYNGVRGSGVRDSMQSVTSFAPSDPVSQTDVRRSTSSAGNVKQMLEMSHAARSQAPLTSAHSNEQNVPAYTTLADITNRGVPPLLSSGGSGERDVVSELLQRGQKLRQAMIMSTLNDATSAPTHVTGSLPYTLDSAMVDNASDKLLRDVELELNDAVHRPARHVTHDTVHDTDKFAIGRGFGSVGVGVRAGAFDVGSTSETSDMEERAIDLVLGQDGDDIQAKLMREYGGSPTESLSGGDDVLSDVGDPIYDDGLLQELFYRNPETDESDISLGEQELETRRNISLGEQERETKTRREADSCDSVSESLHEPGNMRPPSRTGSRRSSSSSILLDLEPTRDTDPAPPLATRRKRRKKKKTLRADDSDVMSSSRVSESSRVSFDPAPSDGDDPKSDSGRREKAGLDGLSVERLTLLGRVHVARVMIDSLSLSDPHLATPTKTKTRSRTGKPPRPVKKACTYFIEYSFPVVATSRDKYSPSAMATEVMRVASKKVSDGLVTFGHRSVFPVLFDGDAIDKWWRSALVFKVYSRMPSQKVPELLGVCSTTLKSVLKSESLYLERSLEVKDRSASGSSSRSLNRSKTSEKSVGFLKLIVELASDSKDFAKALAKTRLAEMTNARMVALPQTPTPQLIPGKLTSRSGTSGAVCAEVHSTAGTQTEPRPLNMDTAPLAPPTAPLAPPTAPQAPPLSQYTCQHEATPLDAYTNTMDKGEALTLHTLVMIPNGENITNQGICLPRHGDKNPTAPPQPITGWTGRDTTTRNLYLTVRMFWCEDTARSDICWGSVDPVFKFSQVVPVLLTTSLLERLRNNFMIVEVWDKKTSSVNDQLVGIVKLPLHQFYMSYRDRRIAASLHKSQYPVVSVDTHMPVVNPFTSASHGQLKVLLAMGSVQQVTALQNLKSDNGSAVMAPERPLHYLERHHLGESSMPGTEHRSENIVEHTFEVSVEAVRALRLLDSMIWGEADCFVQYHFPSQLQTNSDSGPTVVHAGLSLKTFRTATTLCIPDPVFNDVLQHKITMAEGTPVQREILTACAGAGGGAGGVPLEVWCRYYYPNTRDQVIAKAVLPLAKLCAMVTMKRQGEANTQTFTLPLHPVTGDPNEQQTDAVPSDSGLLDLTITYRTHTQQGATQTSGETLSRSLPGAQVCISVSILRASALKAAVMQAARQDPAMQYAAEVGANTYIRVNMSFLQKQDERVTRTVARSFAPEFSYHLDFPVPLLWTELDCDALSLAEILDSAEVNFEVWHETPSSKYDVEDAGLQTCGDHVTGRRLVSKTGDVLLGTTTVPLVGLLRQTTGIRGWFPVNAPHVTWDAPDDGVSETQGSRGLISVVGGLEVALRFAHGDARQRVLNAARAVGWTPSYDVDSRDWEDADDTDGRFSEVTVAADVVCCPLVSVLMAGHDSMDAGAKIYIRYKFYDRNAVSSKMAAVSVNDEDYVTCELRHSKKLVVPSSGPFLWYLNEEQLEVQVWLSHSPRPEKSSQCSAPRPRHRDKLIGSAFLPLHTLADQRRRQHRLSGVFPLFKPGSANLGGACVRAHVTLRPQTRHLSSESEESDGHCHHAEDTSGESTSRCKSSPKEASRPVDVENTFSAYISIERALHLPCMSHRDSGSRCAPSCYVSYQTAERDMPVCTDVVYNDTSPTWSHNLQTRLHKELLTDDSKHLVFKVWHKPDGGRPEPDKNCDRVIGFVSVDLHPLSRGFSQITGWYNIMDFNGICQGQIQIAVTPHESVTELTNVVHQIDSKCSFGGICAPHVSSQLDGESQGILSRFSQHYENVKHFHESLAARLGTHREESSSHTAHIAPDVSRSSLFRSLRSNIADLDNITGKLKTRLHTGSMCDVQSPREQFNHTNNSQQTETETSALTNSQQFLPLPADVGMSATDGELPTLTGTKSSMLSTGVVSMPTQNSAELRFATEMLQGTLPQGVASSRIEEDEKHLDAILAGAPSLDKTPFGSYRPTCQRSSEEEEEEDGAHLMTGVGEFHMSSHEELSADTDGELQGEVVIPRALNDISNVNFNNMISSYVPTQDYSSKLTEEDSWFGPNSPPKEGHLQYTMETLPDELDDKSDPYVNEDSHMLKTNMGTGEMLEPTLTSFGGTVTSIGDPLTTLGGTATTLGSVIEDDPYGRTLVGGLLNKATKLNLNYEDSWMTNNVSINAADERDHEEASLSETAEQGFDAPNMSDQPLEKSVLSPEEKSLLTEEDPLSFLSVSRTNLSDTASHKVSIARKAAMYRREYDRHRNGDTSSEEEDHRDSTGSDAGSRIKSRHRKSRSSPTKKHHNDRKSPTVYKSDTEPAETYPHNVPDVTTPDDDSKGYLRDAASIEDGDDSRVAEATEDNAYDIDHSGEVHAEMEDSCGQMSDAQSRQNVSKSSSASVPNFFLPSSDLEQSMRALRTATLDKSGLSSQADHSASSPRSLLSGRFSATSSAKTKPLPDLQHSQRIAKIFSSKYAS